MYDMDKWKFISFLCECWELCIVSEKQGQKAHKSAHSANIGVYYLISWTKGIEKPAEKPSSR